MEIVDYAKYRAKVAAAAFFVGLVVIVAVTLSPSHRSWRASAQVLVRPPSSVASTYASDPDRYISTQLSVLKLPDFAHKVAVKTRQPEAAIATAVSTTHEPSSEIVTMVATEAKEREAVAIVNAAADEFVSEMSRGALKGLREQQRQLASSAVRVATQLETAATALQRASDRYQAQHPFAQNLPAESTLLPAVAAQQVVLTTRLGALSQQQAQVATQISGANSSQVLERATAAIRPSLLTTTQALSALLGVAALLLFGLVAGLTLSGRVLNESRWTRRAMGRGLNTPVSIRGRGAREADRTWVQVDGALRDLQVATGTSKVSALLYPGGSSRLVERSQFLLDNLAGRRGAEVVSKDSLSDVIDSVVALARPGLVVLLVDAVEVDLADVDRLLDLEAATLERVLPVLVCP